MILIAVNAHENHVNYDSYDRDGCINCLLLCKKLFHNVVASNNSNHLLSLMSQEFRQGVMGWFVSAPQCLAPQLEYLRGGARII